MSSIGWFDPIAEPSAWADLAVRAAVRLGLSTARHSQGKGTAFFAQEIVVGLYADPPTPGGTYHGYLVEDGRFAACDVPGSTLSQICGLNSCADFLGLYDDVDGNEQGRPTHSAFFLAVPVRPTDSPRFRRGPQKELTKEAAPKCGNNSAETVRTSAVLLRRATS